MDASQYKDYVLTLLFMKYVSDKVCQQARCGNRGSVAAVPDAPGGDESGSFEPRKVDLLSRENRAQASSVLLTVLLQSSIFPQKRPKVANQTRLLSSFKIQK